MKRPQGRTLAEFHPLLDAEQALLTACERGDLAVIGSVCPESAQPENTVRAGFVAFLAMGGDDHAPVHHQGVWLQGAWIDGDLSLRSAVLPFNVRLYRCRLAGANLDLRDAEINGSLLLSGSQTQGLSLDGAVVKGSVFLQGGFKANGTVRLRGAQVGGSLECSGAQLDGQSGDALCLDGAVVKGSVFLNDGFKVSGTVRMLGAQVGGSLECNGAQLDGQGGETLWLDRAVVKGSVFLQGGFQSSGTVRMRGTQVDGDLSCSGAQLDGGKQGVALSMEGTQIAGTWFLRPLNAPLTGVELTGCRVERLVDDAASWGSNLRLDGFVYTQLAGDSPVNASDRIDWLRKQTPDAWGSKQDNGGFKPQPWLQLQKVLREMGHLEDARQVAIALEDHRRAIGLVGQTPQTWSAWRRMAYGKTSVFLHWAFKILIGYGYRPLRLVGWMFLVWVFSAAVFWFAALQGAMGPSNPLVFNDPELRKACATNWYLCEKLPEEYTGFSPLAYSLDVLLPLVNLEQEKDWAPLIPTPKSSWWQEWFANWSFKHVARLVVWAEILFGWIASLLLVAVFSGLTKRREE